MLSALEALERLREGNRRFVSGVRSLDTLMSQTRRNEFVAGQAPFSVILGCSDSRVPVELVFDQGLGDLFVIRVAGNIVAASQIGSVEFAAERFGTRLVVVLGHTLCGAVQATVSGFAGEGGHSGYDLQEFVHAIRSVGFVNTVAIDYVGEDDPVENIDRARVELQAAIDDESTANTAHEE